MDFLERTIMATMTTGSVFIDRYIRKHGTLIAVCMFTAVIVLNAAAALGFFSEILVFLLDSIFCGILLFIVFLSRGKKILSFPASTLGSREIDVTSLLEREIISLDIAGRAASLKGRRILVTGAAGSIGSELCRQLLRYEPALLIALDTNETGLFDLMEDLNTLSYQSNAHLYPFIGDVTDKQRMVCLFAEKRPEIVFHAAAYKHVPLLEQYPDLAIRTNSFATNQLCLLAQEYEVDCFVLISTDKAVDPVSVMGASKRLAEMIVQARARLAHGRTRFCAVRFGNVIGSRGSVVPIFTRQIEKGGPLTVTDPEATRYFMTIPEACMLLILTSVVAEQGGLYLLNMGSPVRILDLAGKMLGLYGFRERDIPIVYTGLRPGERLHETLIAADEEVAPTISDNILCISPKGVPLSLDTLLQYLAALEKSLQLGDNVRLREHLFEIVGGLGDVVVMRSAKQA